MSSDSNFVKQNQIIVRQIQIQSKINQMESDSCNLDRCFYSRYIKQIHVQIKLTKPKFTRLQVHGNRIQRTQTRNPKLLTHLRSKFLQFFPPQLYASRNLSEVILKQAYICCNLNSTKSDGDRRKRCSRKDSWRQLERASSVSERNFRRQTCH